MMKCTGTVPRESDDDDDAMMAERRGDHEQNGDLSQVSGLVDC